MLVTKRGGNGVPRLNTYFLGIQQNGVTYYLERKQLSEMSHLLILLPNGFLLPECVFRLDGK